MTKIRVLLILTSCSQKYPISRLGTVHDYVIDQARLDCKNNSGLHYIISNKEIYKDEEGRDRKPCSDNYIFRCQDGTDIKYNSGIAYCFISEMQMKESLGEVK